MTSSGRHFRQAPKNPMPAIMPVMSPAVINRAEPLYRSLPVT